MPRTKNATPSGCRTHRNSSPPSNDNFDAFHFLSREAQDKHELSQSIQPCCRVNFFNFDCYDLISRLIQVSWDLFVPNSQPVNSELVKIFYANASYNLYHSTISSRVRDKIL